MDLKTFGVEIEGIFDLSYVEDFVDFEWDEEQYIINKKNKKIFFEFTEDGSVTKDDGDYSEYSVPAEIRTIGGYSYSEIKDFIDFVLENNFICYTNRSCGFHIHIKPKRQLDLYKIFNYMFTDLFELKAFETFEELENRKREYCFKNQPRHFERLSDGRYFTVNFRRAYRSHETFEVRLFPSNEKLIEYFDFTYKFLKNWEIDKNKIKIGEIFKI